MKVEQAKEIDMVDYLSQLGHHPTKVSGKSYWYYSPFHEERTPSFKINRQLNRWYDFSEGKGGNLIDFGVKYHHCDVKTLLEMLSQKDQVQAHTHEAVRSKNIDENSRTIEIVFATELRSLVLQNYLRSRAIDPQLGKQFLQEINYSIGGNNYYALGFQNDAGGYEIRNKNFKGSSSPKDIRFIDNGSKDLAVFEGFFNLLSYLQVHGPDAASQPNFIVLNSTSFFEKSLDLMQRHDRNFLYLDNDATGNKFTQMAVAINSSKFIDERHQYKKCNDLNEWLVKEGIQQKPFFRQKP